jgi:hypothetical protein
MAVFLTAVNDTLKRVGLIAGDLQNLVTSTITSTATGLTATEAFNSQSQIQHHVDLMVQLWREGVNELFSHGLLAKEAATGSVTLITNQREYALATDFERFAGPMAAMRAATDVQVLFEYPGGYHQMLIDQPLATQWTGEPQSFALSPADDKVRMDRDPTSAENGSIYYYLYEKTIALTSTMATTALPFSEETYISMVPYIAQWFERARKTDFDEEQFKAGLARAVKAARRLQPNARYGARKWR